jgi:hypothetical protein
MQQEITAAIQSLKYTAEEIAKQNKEVQNFMM